MAPSVPASTADTTPESQNPRLGLMTSLPLYWSPLADFTDIASGAADVPWQRPLLERKFALVPLDTLSPIAGLNETAGETDPLEGLEYLAIIQPRGLSPADNAALDGWVRGGGQLLLALDPLLTGEYSFALGDPRRPVDTALVPPIVGRWGLRIAFDETQAATREVRLADRAVIVSQAGQIDRNHDRAAAGGSCEIAAEGTVARCRVGAGAVTLIADAAMFEHRDLIGADGEAIAALLAYAFAQ